MGVSTPARSIEFHVRCVMLARRTVSDQTTNKDLHSFEKLLYRLWVQCISMIRWPPSSWYLRDTSRNTHFDHLFSCLFQLLPYAALLGLVRKSFIVYPCLAKYMNNNLRISMNSERRPASRPLEKRTNLPVNVLLVGLYTASYLSDLSWANLHQQSVSNP